MYLKWFGTQRKKEKSTHVEYRDEKAIQQEMECANVLPGSMNQLIVSYLGTGGKRGSFSSFEKILKKETEKKEEQWKIHRGRNPIWYKKNKLGTMVICTSCRPHILTFLRKKKEFSRESNGMIQFPDWNETTVLYESAQTLSWKDIATEKECSIPLSTFSSPIQWGLVHRGIVLIEKKEKRGYFIEVDTKQNLILVHREYLLDNVDQFSISSSKEKVYSGTKVIHYSK